LKETTIEFIGDIDKERIRRFGLLISIQQQGQLNVKKGGLWKCNFERGLGVLGFREEKCFISPSTPTIH